MTQILHSVQDDSTCPVSQILHSAPFRMTKEATTFRMTGHHFFAPHLFPSLTCVQAIINIRSRGHLPCAHVQDGAMGLFRAFRRLLLTFNMLRKRELDSLHKNRGIVQFCKM